jgi:hypothetical protein
MSSPLGELVAQEAEIDAEHAQLVLEVFIGFGSIRRQQNARGTKTPILGSYKFSTGPAAVAGA